jgi:hypothetical protein
MAVIFFCQLWLVHISDMPINLYHTSKIIRHIGHSTLHTPHNSLQLKNILHVSSASKNLLSIHKLARDNDVFC